MSKRVLASAAVCAGLLAILAVGCGGRRCAGAGG